MVAMAAPTCSGSAWWNAPWAQVILSHPKCTAAAQNFKTMAEQHQPTAALLAQLHICIRHILAHEGTSIDVKKVCDGYPFSNVEDTSEYLRRIAQHYPFFSTLSQATAYMTSTAASASSSAAGVTPASGIHTSSSSSANTSNSALSITPVSALKERPLAFLNCKQQSSSWFRQCKSGCGPKTVD